MKVYGIKNCDTVKKALQFLDKNKIEYTFVDFKKYTPTKSDIQRWKKEFGDFPANKKGPTFRKIKEQFEAADAAGKTELLIENTSAIKRPIVEGAKQTLFGFDEIEWSNTLK